MKKEYFWVFYHNERPKDIYAYTENKKVAHAFMEQRNMNHYFLSKINKNEFSETNQSIFNYINQKHLLFENVLSDGCQDIYFVTTVEENCILDIHLTKFNDYFINVKQKLSKIKLKEELQTFLDEILDYYDIKTRTIEFDSFHYFIKLFKDYIL